MIDHDLPDVPGRGCLGGRHWAGLSSLEQQGSNEMFEISNLAQALWESKHTLTASQAESCIL